MERLELVIHNKIILPKALAKESPPPPTNNKPKIKHPISTQLISMEPTIELYNARLGHYHQSPSLPQAFKPTDHPAKCKCQKEYKSAPDRLPNKTTLWINTGPPITRTPIYVWNCVDNSPECTVYYDGGEDGILNYFNSTLLSHVVLLDCLFSLLTSKGETFDGFVTRKHLINTIGMNVDCNTQVAFLQKATFIKVYNNT